MPEAREPGPRAYTDPLMIKGQKVWCARGAVMLFLIWGGTNKIHFLQSSLGTTVGMRQQQKFCWLQLEASKVQNSQPLRAASFTVVATCFNHSGGLKKIRDQYLSPRWAGSFGRIHILIRRSFAYVSGSFVMFRMQINISSLGLMNSFRK